jgi:bacteriocin biosynthesis cyclodehydratase domain-containing protein
MNRAYAIIPLEDGVQLRAGDEEIVFLEVADVESAAALLSGWAAEETIERPTDALGQALFDALLDEAILVSGQPMGSSDLEDYLSHAPQVDGARLASARAELWVQDECGQLEDLLREAIQAHGVEVNLTHSPSPNSAGDDALTVALAAWERPDYHRVRQWNAEAVRRRQPCLFVDLSHGRHATLGPFFIPAEGACYECFRTRQRENSESLDELEAAEELMLRNEEALPGYGVLPAHRYWLVGLAVGELLSFWSRHRPLRTCNRAVTVDFETLRTWSEPVWRIPWCERCRQ